MALVIGLALLALLAPSLGADAVTWPWSKKEVTAEPVRIRILDVMR